MTDVSDSRNTIIDEMHVLLDYMRTPGVRAVKAFDRWTELNDMLYADYVFQDYLNIEYTEDEYNQITEINLER